MVTQLLSDSVIISEILCDNSETKNLTQLLFTASTWATWLVTTSRCFEHHCQNVVMYWVSVDYHLIMELTGNVNIQWLHSEDLTCCYASHSVFTEK